MCYPDQGHRSQISQISDAEFDLVFYLHSCRQHRVVLVRTQPGNNLETQLGIHTRFWLNKKEMLMLVGIFLLCNNTCLKLSLEIIHLLFQ